MAFIGVKIPPEIASRLAQIEVPGNRIELDEMHITLLYLGKDIPITKVLQATLASYLLTKRWAPFQAMAREVTVFPRNPDDGIPVIAKVICPELHKFQKAMKKSFDFMGVEYSKKYPEYIPHITLAYTEENMQGMEIEPVIWDIEELVIWGGNEGIERIAVTLPLEGDPSIAFPF